MAFLSADRIHNGYGWLPAGSVLEVADDGTIVSVSDAPNPEAIFYEGILIPGFVNAHCHIELSHMKGVVPEHTGLIPFLKHIPQHRNDFTEEQKQDARFKAYQELLRNGVVAIGDISNTADVLDLRGLEGLHFHTFVEALGFKDEHAPGNFEYSLNVYNAYSAQASKEKILRQSIVPHAPYSVSPTLFKLIDAHEEKVLISIHNQESEDENLYYKAKQGRVPELLSVFGIDDSHFVPSGKSSIQTYLDWMLPDHPFVFVHNTCTSKEDVHFVRSRLKQAYWCLCPNANLYIENKLPDIDMLISENANICIGTDSLSSNHQLSILSELSAIKQHFPHLNWDTLIKWGTLNGAKALQMQDVVGSFDAGKKPGVVQLTGLGSGTLPEIRRVI